MSGIAGIYHLDGRPADPMDLARMTDVMTHRGPDGISHWRERSVGLGHLMLHATPESPHAKLPLTDRSGNFTITADARIDNRAELIGRLGLNGKPTVEISDSELILAAYKKWGDECPDKLLGAFAFAIWDEREQQLFCARDHFGVKPFYYYHEPGQLFAFASEIKALFTLDAVPQTLNERRIARHMLMPVEESAADTFYEDVRALKPAHIGMVQQSGSFHNRRYWALDPEREVHFDSDEEYAEALRDIFTEAVRCRMRSTTPISAMLSGGLDSSSIASTAAHLREQNDTGPDGSILTLSAIFDEVPVSDEQPYIQAVLEKYDGLEPHYFHADQQSPLKNYDKVLWHLDQANGAGNHYINWNLYHTASKRGSRVVLDGFDGDTSISHGRRRLMELAKQEQFWTLLKEVKAYTKNIGKPWKQAVWKWSKYALNPVISRYRPLRYARWGWRALAYRTKWLWQWENSDEANFGQDAWHAALKDEFLHKMEPFRANDSPPMHTERAHHYQLLTRVLMARTLELLDATAAAASVEVRLPFYDKRLIEFCLAVPAEQKMSGGYTRLIMRRAMEGILPDKIQWRPEKSNLGPSFDHGLLGHEKERLQTFTERDTGRLSRFVDLSAIREASRRYTSGALEGRSALLVWRALSLALWLEHFEESSTRSLNAPLAETTAT